ncbi:MAG: hypothetical protein K6T85_00985 [Gorillibacterium sp.]|nr:hypothetical protein [Gorillibacterium sp.]
MNKNDYKRAFDKIEPDQDLPQRLARSMHEKGRNTRVKPLAVAVACFALLLSLGIWADPFGTSKDAAPSSSTSPTTVTDTVVPVVGTGVYLPPMKISASEPGVSASMIGLFVYKGKVYIQAATTITPDAAKLVLGEKLGRTKAGITEWSTQDEYATEFASTIGTTDIYTVKGYDSEFRLMSYQVQDGEVWAEYYECVNDLMIKSGADLLGLLKLTGNVQSAKWERFDSWNNGLQQYQEIADTDGLTTFLQALNEAKPLPAQPLAEAGIYDNGNQGFLLLKLQDNSEVHLRLFKDGYVKYGNADVFFQVDASTFSVLWNQVEPSK